jgi:heat shock protein HslJ
MLVSEEWRLKKAWMVVLVMMSACVSQKAVLSFDQVLGKEWKLTGIRVENADTGYSRDGLGAGFSNSYTLIFQDGMIGGRAAPNSYRGPFVLTENQGISFDKLAATLMAVLGEPGGLSEDEYFDYLEEVYRWDIRDGKLELYTKNNEGKAGILEFSE